jgi:proton-dependent oligopeptide transporter, POT family
MSLPVDEKTFFGQPRALATLFFTEMWERFSYYGMRAILVLYLITPPDGATPPGGGLGYSDAEAAAIYGTYASLVYLLPLLGGWVADRLTGPRRAVLMGGIVIAMGHFIMAVPVEALFWSGLLIIAIGTGLLKPSVSAMVGGLYAPDDTRRDGGFSIFYMGINLGALIAPLIVGYLGEDINWHLGFAVAGVGMLLGLAQYVAGWRGLGSVGRDVPNPATPVERRRAGIQFVIALAIIIVVLVVAFGFLGLGIADITVLFTFVVIAIAIIYFWRLFRQPQLTGVDRDRLRAFLYLFLAAVVFWAIYDQGGSTINEFASSYTNMDAGAFTIPISWLQSINPVFIIIFAPIFAVLWTKLGQRAPSTPVKFAMAIFGVGISFLIMVPAALQAEGGQKSAVWWIVSVFLVQTWSELLLSPNGLSATTKLAPAGLLSQMLAVWFLATAVGDSIGGQLVRLIDVLGWAGYFVACGIGTVILGGLFVLVVPKIKVLMEGVD